MRPMMMIAMATALMMSLPASAQAATCGTATLDDVQVITELVPTPTVTTARMRPENRGVHEWFGYTTPNRRLSKRYLVTVRLNDVVYTGESSGDGFWNFNPTTLVINDSFHACASKDRLRLTRPDGKEYSAKIVRVVRDSQLPSLPQSQR